MPPKQLKARLTTFSILVALCGLGLLPIIAQANQPRSSSFKVPFPAEFPANTFVWECSNQSTLQPGAQTVLRSIRLERSSRHPGADRLSGANSLFWLALSWISKRASEFSPCGVPVNLGRVQDSLKTLNREILLAKQLEGSALTSEREAALYELVPAINPNGTLLLTVKDKVIGDVQINRKTCDWDTHTFSLHDTVPIRGQKPDAFIRQALGFGPGDRSPDAKTIAAAEERLEKSGLFHSISFGRGADQDPDKITWLVCVKQRNEADLTFSEAQKINPQASADAARAAVAKYKKALELLQQVKKDSQAEAASLQNQRTFRVTAYQGGFIWGKGIDSLGESDILVGMAAGYNALGEFYQALHYYDRTLAAMRATNATNDAAVVLGAIAEIHQTLGDAHQAHRYYKSALSAALQTQRERLAASDLFNLQDDQLPKGRQDSPTQCGAVAPSLSAQAEPSPDLDLLQVQPAPDGSATFKLNLAPAAMAEFWRSKGDVVNAADLTRSAANDCYLNKKFPQAIQRLNQALDVYRKANDAAETAETLTYLATVYNAQASESNQPQARQAALESYYQALDQWQKVNDRPKREGEMPLFGARFSKQADERFAIASLYERLEQPKAALDYTIQALLTGANATPSSSEAERLLFMGALYGKLRQPQQAMAVYHKALSILEAQDNKDGQAEALFFLGMTSYLSLNQPQPAIGYLSRAQALWSTLNSPKVGEALSAKAWIAHKTGSNPKAIQFLEQAMSRYRAAGDRQGELKASMLQGFLYQAQGDTTQAIASYKQTISAIESLRDAIKLDDLKAKFVDKHIDLYANLVNLLWNTGHYPEAFAYVERAKARSLLDQLSRGRINPRSGATPALAQRERDLHRNIAFLRQQLANLQRSQLTDTQKVADLKAQLAAREAEYTTLLAQFQTQNLEFVRLKQGDITPLNEIQQRLDPETTLVEYYVTRKRTFVFLITRTSFKSVALNLEQSQLTDAVQSLLNQNETGTSVNLKPRSDAAIVVTQVGKGNFANLDRLQQLHHWLIAPLLPDLQTRKLAIVPHGALHYLPFAALTQDGKRFLHDDHALVMLPSASVLEFVQQKRKPNPTTLLVLGNPTPTQPLRSLKFAEQEARDIATCYQTKPLLNKDATEAAVWSQASRAGVVHLAAHGLYNANNPLFSTLFLAGNPQADNSHNDGRLEAREVYELDLTQATHLVVLSACQTQLGNLSNGDEVVGLNRAFLYAGTPSVLASLWSVDDEATGLLMQRFYTHLQTGMEKAEALRHAQQEMRTTPRYQNPYYWAAFSLTGDGDRLPDNASNPNRCVKQSGQ